MSWPNRAELLKRLGSRRITAAEDFEDRWRYHFSYLLKPRHLLAATGLAVGIMLAVTLAIWLTGFQLVSHNRAQLASFAEAAIGDGDALTAAEVRVRVAGAARALTFVDRVITGPLPDYDKSSWHVRLFGRRSPTVDPGRAAVFVSLIDRINAAPIADQQGLIDGAVLRAANDAKSVPILNLLADLPDDLRALLLRSDAAQFREVIAWLKRRPLLASEEGSLGSAIRVQQQEIAQTLKAGRELVLQLTLDLERNRDQRATCRRHAEAFQRCMNVAVPR